MRNSSPYDAAVAAVVAEAEALLAFEAAIHDLEQLQLEGSAHLLRIFRKNTVIIGGPVNWAFVSGLISSVLQVYSCACDDDSREGRARTALSALRDASDKAWCAGRRARELRGRGGA